MFSNLINPPIRAANDLLPATKGELRRVELIMNELVKQVNALTPVSGIA